MSFQLTLAVSGVLSTNKLNGHHSNKCSGRVLNVTWILTTSRPQQRGPVASTSKKVSQMHLCLSLCVLVYSLLVNCLVASLLMELSCCCYSPDLDIVWIFLCSSVTHMVSEPVHKVCCRCLWEFNHPCFVL